MAGMENTVSEGTTWVNLKMSMYNMRFRKATFSQLRRNVGNSFLADLIVKSADGFEARFSASLLAAASPVLAEALEGGASGGKIQVQRSLSDETSLLFRDCSGRTVRALLDLISNGDGGLFASPEDFEEAWHWTRVLGLRGPRKLMMCAVCPTSIMSEVTKDFIHHLKSHREDIITHFFIPNKTDPRNAARSCPACRNVFHNPSDAITHAQKCLDLIKDQENWIEGRRNEDAVATPSSNGSVSRQISAESSNDGVESRPSCHECGKFFKTAFAQKKHKCKKKLGENGDVSSYSKDELVSSKPPNKEAKSNNLPSNVQPPSSSLNVQGSLLDMSDEDDAPETTSSDKEPNSRHNVTDTTPPLQDNIDSLFDTIDEDSTNNKEPKSGQQNPETPPVHPIADSENDTESTGTDSDAHVKATLHTLYRKAMKKKPPKCFFPHCKNKPLNIYHLVVMHLVKVIDLEIPKDLSTYKCYACPLKFESRNSYLMHLRSEEWKREPPSFLEKYSLDSKEVQPPNLDLRPFIDNVRGQGSSKSASSPAKTKETFKCAECLEEFPTSLALMHHKSVHSYAQVSDDDEHVGVEYKGTGEDIKSTKKFDGFFTCQICGKENPKEENLNMHLVTHFKEQILEKHPPIVGENNKLTCSINGCQKSFAASNPYNTKTGYLRHVGVVHKFFKEHFEEAVRRHNDETKRTTRPSVGAKRKASSAKTSTPPPKKQKDDEPVAGTSGNQKARKNSTSPVRIRFKEKKRICQLCPSGFPNFSEFRRHLTNSHFREKILQDFPPVYEEGCFKCLFDGCGKTFKDKQTYIAHRGGVHWQGALDKYISERGKDINVDGEWPEGDIKWMKVKKDSPVASTPINGSSKKKRGRPPSFNTPDAPCSPATKKKPKDITCDSCHQSFTSNENKRLHTCDSLLDRHYAVDEREKRRAATEAKSMRESSTNDEESDLEIRRTSQKLPNAIVDSSSEEEEREENLSESLKLSFSSESPLSDEDDALDDEDSDDDRDVRKCLVCGAKFSNPGERADHIDATGHGREESKLPF